ncbi:MAG TPA: ATP-binding protein [Polyangiaceae bacterium]|nr:ATP-binding protein [Polyangiaceae bacterium]
MRLVLKLSMAFMAGTTALLGVNGYFRVRREVVLFQTDRARDLDLIGRTLGTSFGAVWRSEGEGRAMQLVDAANSGGSRIHVRWVWLDPGADLRVDRALVEQLPAGTTLTRIAPDRQGTRERFTYVPVRVDGDSGALELSEGLDAERSYTGRTVEETVRTTLILALVTTSLSYVLGFWLVGRPIRALVDKARRLGQGEFGHPVRLRQRDELAELAQEMNATGSELERARESAMIEAAGRVAALEQLRHADRLTTVGKLASGVAHELGTPLNVVVARAQMISSGATAEESREYAAIIVDSARKMTRIIRQLLEFARRRGPRKEHHDVAQVVERTLEMLRPLADRAQAALVPHVDGGPFEASFDVAQIEQAVANLVVNSIQALHQGGQVQVRVARERAVPPADHGGPAGDWIAVRVRDDGEGIPRDELPHVFEPFFTTKDVGSGTGLGLSVAYGIVRDHGGWIEASSEVGSGSTFSFYLPVDA